MGLQHSARRTRPAHRGANRTMAAARLSLTYGDEKTYRWQMGLHALRRDCENASAVSAQLRGLTHAHNQLLKRHKGVQMRALRRTIFNWKAGRYFRQWDHYAARRAQLGRLTRRGGARMARKRRAQVFQQWVEHSRAGTHHVDEELLALRSQLQRTQRGAVARACRRLQSMLLARAFSHWRSVIRQV